MTIRRLSVTATMLLGIDRFVAVAEDGVAVPHSARRVQPWLCGEALLGGAIWALWTDGVIEPVDRGPDFRLCGNADYPDASLERLVQASVSDRPEPPVDTLTRALEFARVQPWNDVVEVVHGELLAAGYPLDEPPPTNGHRPRFLLPANQREEGDETAPVVLASILERLSGRWDRWWSSHDEMLVSVARACHDSLVARRLGAARALLHGLPFPARPRDPAEAAAGQARPRCPRWARQL